MYLESLIRLAEIVDHYNQKKEFLVSEKFHKDTEELITAQSKFLAADLEFRANNEGPYDFGFGDVILTIYSPEQTEIQEWAMIARKNDWQRAYRFNSVIGLVKALSTVINDTENSEKETER